MRRSVAVLAICTFALLGFGRAAWSQEGSLPDELFQQGVDLAIHKQYAEAIVIWLPLLRAADDGFATKIQKATALAYKKLKRFPEAWHYLTLYLRNSPKEDVKAGAWLEGVEKELMQVHQKVVFTCEPDGVVLSLQPPPQPGSGQAASGLQPDYSCPLTWWFVPGRHELYAHKEGFEPRLVQIDVQARGDQGVHEIKLVAIVPQPEPPADIEGGEPGESHSITGITKPAEPKRESNALAWVLAGSGAAVAMTGGVLQLLADSRNETLHDKYMDKAVYQDGAVAKGLYDSDYEEEVQPKRIGAFVLYGVGGAAVVAGAVLLAVSDDPKGDGPESTVAVTPVPLPGGAGAMMSLEF